jgi:hypothetical protein
MENFVKKTLENANTIYATAVDVGYSKCANEVIAFLVEEVKNCKYEHPKIILTDVTDRLYKKLNKTIKK